MTTNNTDLSDIQSVIKNELKYLKEKGFSIEFPSAGGCESSRAVLVRALKESVSKKGVHFRTSLSFLKEDPEATPQWLLSVRINNETTHNYRSKNFAAVIGYLENEYKK